MIADSPAVSIQQAVYAALVADTELTQTLGFSVVDDTDAVSYPYVSMGEGTEGPDNVHDQFGRDCTITLHVWSEEAGFTQANQGAARATAVLDHQTLTLTGHRAVAVRFASATRMRDPREQFVRHVAITFRVVTTQTS
ncbi:DUF3168 domain-containing protein [Salininema proteolyticum]|uniref:DUF3168 domain-containing protein n=1 Tax=Salininema proteolyticum TaxID=1607685 RepID=A0ABV8TTW7_9ACTN